MKIATSQEEIKSGKPKSGIESEFEGISGSGNDPETTGRNQQEETGHNDGPEELTELEKADRKLRFEVKKLTEKLKSSNNDKQDVEDSKGRVRKAKEKYDEEVKKLMN